MRLDMKIRGLFKGNASFTGYNLCLIEMLGASMGLATAGPRWRASKIAPGDFVRKNLAALLARFPLNFVPFMQYAG